tara:strand:- start:5 stop:1729 length:1725 start_codon:yes stop_codon:yes gene_type:complete
MEKIKECAKILFDNDIKAKYLMLALACICSIFSYTNNVPILAWACSGFFLAYVVYEEKSVRCFLAGFVLSLFHTISAMDALEDYFTTWVILYPFFVLPLVGASMLQKRLWATRPHLFCVTFVFPTVYTAWWFIWVRIEIIGFGSPAMHYAYLPILRQVVSLFGTESLVFFTSWLTSILVGFLYEKKIARLKQPQREHLLTFVCVWLFLQVYGGLQLGAGRGIWLQDVNKWPEVTKDGSVGKIKISCLTWNAYEGDDMKPEFKTSSLTDLEMVEPCLNEFGSKTAYNSSEILHCKTRHRLLQGDDIVVWSETALGDLDKYSWYESNMPKTPIPTLNNLGNISKKSLVAATYHLPHDGDVKNIFNDGVKPFRNVVSLHQDDKLLAEYHKNIAVPIVEAYVEASSDRPKAVNVEMPSGSFMKIAMAICFDFDFPTFIREAADADLIIGPSWTWKSIGTIVHADSVLRATENGVTIFKCSLMGMTGVIDPYGRTISSIPTVHGDTSIVTAPVQKSRWTLYASGGGFIFGWIVCLFAVLYILLAVLPQKILQKIGISPPNFDNLNDDKETTWRKIGRYA